MGDEILSCPWCCKRPMVEHLERENGLAPKLHRMICSNDRCPVRPRTQWLVDEEVAVLTWNNQPTAQRKVEST